MERKPQHPNSAANIEAHKWKPGQSGNPSGGPKGPKKLAYQLKKRIRDFPEEADAIINKLVADAIAGEPDARRLLFDRHDGPMALKIEGLSDEDITERLVEMLSWLKERLPAEYHPLLAAAPYEVLGHGSDDGVEAAADPE